MFEVLGATVIESEKEKEKEPDPEQITLVMEDWAFEPETLDEQVPLPEPEQVEKETPEDNEPRFVLNEEGEEALPEKNEFIGQSASLASSDKGAEAGKEKMTALAGEKELKADIKLKDLDYTEGQTGGAKKGDSADGNQGDGTDSVEQEEMKEERVQQELQQPEPDQFIDPEVASETVEDQLPKPKPEKPKPEPIEEVLDKGEKDQEKQEKKRQASSGGKYTDYRRKTRVLGVIDSSGKGTLNVDATVKGKYQHSVITKIVREWRVQNYRYRSYIAPGSITFSFRIAADGSVSNISRLAMRGASQIQWGSVVNAIQGPKFPAMPKKLRNELKSEPLEFSITFNY